MTRWLLLAGLQWTTAAQAGVQKSALQPVCPPIDRSVLQRLAEASPTKTIDLIFFSGWCSDCSAHLKGLRDKNAALVGIFDTQARIQRVVGKLNLENPCFTDAGIGKLLDVTTVPTERRISLDSLNRAR